MTTWAISMRWIKPYSIVVRFDAVSVSGLILNLISMFHSYRPVGEIAFPAEKLQQTEEFKDGQKRDYTVTEESI
jgi:hypothetical protein